MRTLLSLYFLIIFLVIGNQCYAQNFIPDGNTFLNQCEKFNPICQGYIQGIVDVIDVYNGWYDPTNCRFRLPSNVTDRQLIDLMIEYYRNNPEIRHHWNAYNIIQLLSETFPCPQ